MLFHKILFPATTWVVSCNLNGIIHPHMPRALVYCLQTSSTFLNICPNPNIVSQNLFKSNDVQVVSTHFDAKPLTRKYHHLNHYCVLLRKITCEVDLCITSTHTRNQINLEWNNFTFTYLSTMYWYIFLNVFPTRRFYII